mmetsp:Transcript_14351/g.24038  ORF Transcript_14351/g.24038 Transcript_14351/m.24038 type:complete len:81 (+) Transcript_14351:321-563(+)
MQEFKGERFAVDLSILMNKFLCSDIDKLATTSTPTYPSPDLLQNIKNWHETYLSTSHLSMYLMERRRLTRMARRNNVVNS